MGKLVYGTGLEVTFDDRELAHLQIVFATKLRRGESFFFSFTVADQPTAIWLQQSIPLQIVFDSPTPISINREWLEELSASANSARGLHLSSEVQAIAP